MALELSIPKEFKGLLRIGTCSWKYDSWRGLVYDRGQHYRPSRRPACHDLRAASIIFAAVSPPLSR